MKRILVCVLAVAAMAITALATDVSGKWTGTFTPENGETHSALLVLKQDGMTVTGTAGPDESQQWPIQNGKIDGSKVILEVKSPEEEGMALKLELLLDGDHLKGDATAKHGDQAMAAKLDLSRAK